MPDQNVQQSSPKVSRRAIAKGAAWATPAVVFSSAAPAFAASRTSVGGVVCSLFYGAGASTNYQTHSLYLGIDTNTDIIPQGTVITWTVQMEGTDEEVPTLTYSPTGTWDMAVSPASGTVATSFTVTFTAHRDFTVSGGRFCAPPLVWTNIYAIEGGSRVTVSAATTGGQVQGVDSSLSYQVAERHPTGVNQSGRQPHIYYSKSGGQDCYPEIQYVLDGASQGYNCGSSGVINSTSTIYPDGTCVMHEAVASEVGSQRTLPAKC